MGMRKIGAATVAVVLALGLVACGGDDGDEDVSLEEVDGSGSGSDTTDTTDDGGSTDDTDPEDGSDTTLGDIDDIDDIDFGSEECQQLIEAMGGFGALFSDGEGTIDFGTFADLFGSIDVPEIEDDLQVMADAYERFDEELGEVDFSDPELFTSPEFIELSQEFNTPEFAEASERVSDYFDEACPRAGG